MNRLTGRVGTDASGWTTLSLARRPDGAAGEPERRPGPEIPVLPPAVKQQAGLYSLVANLPGVSGLAAPEWMKPGVRISFWSGSATINNQAFPSTLTPSATGDDDLALQGSARGRFHHRGAGERDPHLVTTGR